METALTELDEDDPSLVIVNVQISALRNDLARTVLRKHSTENLPLSISLQGTPHSADLKSVTSPSDAPTIPQSFSKLSKNDQHSKEEMQLCILELRRLVDTLATKCEATRCKLAEERAKRVVAEAELMATRSYNYYPPHSPGSNNGQRDSDTEQIPGAGDHHFSPFYSPEHFTDDHPCKLNEVDRMESQSDIWFDANNR